MENKQNFEEQDFEAFLASVDNHYENATMKSRKSGRNKAAYEMICHWYQPEGKKFTFRSDDTLERLKEHHGLNENDELRALLIKYATIRTKARKAKIFDNRKGYPGDLIFMMDNGNILINQTKAAIQPKRKPSQSPTAKKTAPQPTEKIVRGDFASQIEQLASRKRV